MRCFPDLEAKRRVLLQVCNRILSYHIPFLAASYSSSVSSSSYFISFVVTAVLSSSYSSSSSMSSPLPLPLPPLLHALIHHLNPQRLVLITLGRQRSSILAFFLLLRVCGEDEVYNGGQGGGGRLWRIATFAKVNCFYDTGAVAKSVKLQRGQPEMENLPSISESSTGRTLTIYCAPAYFVLGVTAILMFKRDNIILQRCGTSMLGVCDYITRVVVGVLNWDIFFFVCVCVLVVVA